MPVIFGHELKGRTMWVILAVIAAGVGLVVYVRSRAASAGAASQAPSDNTGSGGGGGGIAVPAPTQGIADTYKGALEQQQLAAGQFNLDYQKQLAGERQSQFNLEQQYRQGTLSSEVGLQNQMNLTAAAHEKEMGKASADFCPAGTSTRYDPNTGTYVCRNKSGGFAFIGQISSAIQNIFSGATSGAAAAAPGAAAGVVNRAAQYYSGQWFPTAGGQLPAIARSAGPSGDQSSLAASPGGYNQPGYHQVGGGYGVALPVSMMQSGHNG